MQIQIRQIDKPKDYKYKRRIWAGTRNNPPKLDDTINIGRSMILKDEVLDIKLYPVLLMWETTNGERKYSEITKAI
jgi:hypothetical protein